MCGGFFYTVCVTVFVCVFVCVFVLPGVERITENLKSNVTRHKDLVHYISWVSEVRSLLLSGHIKRPGEMHDVWVMAFACPSKRTYSGCD